MRANGSAGGILVAVVGPTAVGKTEVSLLLAERMGAEIVSVDSMQVYRGMDIGTAKPTPAERRRVPHHLIDVVSPEESFSAGMFRDMALAAVGDIERRGRLPLLVGGTGLYLRTLSRGLCDAPPADEELRARLHGEADREGRDALLARLRRVDPASAERLAQGDLRRIVRALEVHTLTGLSLSEIQRSGTLPPAFRLQVFVLNRRREDLYARIDERVDMMIRDGLVAEVKALRSRYRLARGPLQALGYKEILAHLDGAADLDDAVRTIKTRTRNFAKRQLTWFRKEPSAIWMDLAEGTGGADACAAIEQRLANLPESGYS